MTEGGGDEYDVVILGSGSGGGVLAGELAEHGHSVAVVERGLVGGECPYLACVPSKALLLAARGVRESGGDPAAAWAEAVRLRDKASQHRDDGRKAHALQEHGVTLVRGEGRVDGPGRVVVDDAADGARTLRWRRALVVATGSAPVIPPVEGLADAPTWTFDQALSGDELPGRLTILGGGAVGCELAQVYASFGARVTLVEAAPRLLHKEAGWAGELLAEVLRGNGVEVRTGVALEHVTAGTPATLHLADGSTVTADRILVAVGKKPRVDGIGLETLGIAPGEHGELVVDARGRIRADGSDAGDGVPDVFAVGDVTALAPYTHTANYQGRVVAAELAGRGRDADLTGIPRAVYTDPPVLAVGETAEQARERGAEVLTASFDPTRTVRGNLERMVAGRDLPGRLEIVADAATGVVLGATAIGPEADSWGHELALAVRLRTTAADLAGAVQAFPAWTEAIHIPAREIADKLAGG